MARLPNPQLADQWRRRLRRFDNADTTVAQFCRQEQCSVASFYQWRRNFQTDQQENVGGEFIAVDLTHAAGGETVEPASAMIQIELPGGAIVRLDADAGQSLLHNAIAAIVQATNTGRAS